MYVYISRKMYIYMYVLIVLSIHMHVCPYTYACRFRKCPTNLVKVLYFLTIARKESKKKAS